MAKVGDIKASCNAMQKTCIRETVVSKTDKSKASEAKTRFSYIAEALESTGQRIESVTKRIHEEHIAGKGQNSVLHHNLVHKFIPMPQAMKIPDAKAAVDKEWKKLETIRLISYIHFTSDCRQYCHLGNAAQHCRLGSFQDSDFAGDLEDSNPHQAEFCAFLEVEHLHRLVGCARSKRQYVTAPQNQRSYRWMLVCVWMVYLRSTCGIWFLKCLERLTEYQNQPKRAHVKPV